MRVIKVWIVWRDNNGQPEYLADNNGAWTPYREDAWAMDWSTAQRYAMIFDGKAIEIMVQNY